MLACWRHDFARVSSVFARRAVSLQVPVCRAYVLPGVAWPPENVSSDTATWMANLPELISLPHTPFMTSTRLCYHAQPWGRRDSRSSSKWSSTNIISCAQQSVEGGVRLPPVDHVEDYAPFLARAVRTHLDTEWMQQDCHKTIGDEVERIFRECLTQGVTDLSSLVLDMGAALEKTDMGDAFVGPWDIANLVSDVLMDKMGAETSSCSTKVSLGAGDRETQGSDPEAFHLTVEAVRRMENVLVSDFSRYRFLKDFMNNEEADWSVVNTIVALYQGYTPEDADGQGHGDNLGEPVREPWRRMFPGLLPPDVRTAEGVVEALEADFPKDPDMLEGLEVIIETIYGSDAKQLDSGDPEKGVPANEGFLRRAALCKWMYMMGILQDPVSRVPEDPETLADLVSGRRRLGR